jgi:hypothetical protein
MLGVHLHTPCFLEMHALCGTLMCWCGACCMHRHVCILQLITNGENGSIDEQTTYEVCSRCITQDDHVHLNVGWWDGTDISV